MNRQNPRSTLLIAMLTILLSAIASQYRLGFLPQQGGKEISISTSCTGFLAEEVEERITSPLEEALLPLPGIENIRSLSTRGKSTIHLSFPRDSDMREQYLTVRDRIEGVAVAFPSSVERPRIHFSAQDRAPVFMAFFQRELGYTEASVTRLFTDFGPGRVSPPGGRSSAGANVDLSGIGEIIVRGDTKTEVLYTISPSSLSFSEVPIANLGSFIQNSLAMERVLPENSYPIILQNKPDSLEDLRHNMFPGGIRTETLFTLSKEEEKKETRARVNAADVISVVVTPSEPDMTIRLCKNLESIIEGLEGVKVGINRGKMMERELRKTFLFLIILALSFYSLVFLVFGRVKRPGGIFSFSRLKTVLQKMGKPLFILCFRMFFILQGVVAALTLAGRPVTFITLVSLFPLLSPDSTTFSWISRTEQNPLRQNVFMHKILSLVVWLPFLLYSHFYPAFLTEAFITVTSGTVCSMIFQRILYGGGKKTILSYSLGAQRGNPRKIIILTLGLLTAVSLFVLFKDRGSIDLEGLNPNNSRYLRFRMEYPEGTTTEHAASRGLSVENLLLERADVEFIISSYQGDRGECTILVKNPEEEKRVVRFLHHLSEGFGQVYFHISGVESEEPDLAVTFTAGEDSVLLPSVQEATAAIASMEGIGDLLYNFKPALPYLTVVFDQKKCLQGGVTPLSAQRGLFPFLSSPIIARWTSVSSNTIGFQTKDIRFTPETLITAESLSSFPVKTTHGGKNTNELIPLRGIAEFASQERKKTIFHSRGVPSLTFSIVADPDTPKNELMKAIDARFTTLKEGGGLPQNLNWDIRDLNRGKADIAAPDKALRTLLPCIVIFTLLPCLFLSKTTSFRSSFLLTALFFNGFAVLLLLLWVFTLSGGAALLGILFAGAKGIERTISSMSSMPNRWTIGLFPLYYPLFGLLVSLMPFLGMSSLLTTFLAVYFLGTIIFSILIPFSLTLFYTD